LLRAAAVVIVVLPAYTVIAKLVMRLQKKVLSGCRLLTSNIWYLVTKKLVIM
jgi:hypothetical protein